MKKVVIRRLDMSEEGTFGVLYINGRWICLTLELPWKDNKVSQSCIPAGTYCCSQYNSPRFGETFLVRNVPGRTDILFHVGNFLKDTFGCILLGEGISGSEHKRFIFNSRDAIKSFMRELRNEDSFCLTITEELL
jgi:hypothetical protein